MFQSFVQYLAFNDLPQTEDDLSLAQFITDNPKIKLFSYTNKGFYFLNYKKLVEGNITLEDFFYVGDVISKQEIFSPVEEHQALDFLCQMMIENPTYFRDSIHIINEVSFDVFVHRNPEQYAEFQTFLNSKNARLHVIR